MTPAEFFRAKADLPTEMRTKELSRLPLWVKEQSFFMAGVARAELLAPFREAAQKVLAGELSEQQALRIIREGMKKAKYKAADGQEGTIKDLNSYHRQLLSLQTAVALSAGWAAEVSQLKSIAHPAKELVRASTAKHPRAWAAKLWPAAAAKRNKAHPDLLPLKENLMMAPIGDPVWPMLSDFNAPYDPLKYRTGMRQRAVGAARAIEAGIVDPVKLREKALQRTEPPKEGGAADSGRQPKATVPVSPEPNEPVPSPGSSLEVKPKIPAAQKDTVTKSLKGLGEWKGNTLVFTDPNGTRPYTPEQLAPLIVRPNVDGTTNYQRAAIEEWVRLGGDEEALAEMRRRHRGKDILDDWNRLQFRLQESSPGTSILDLLSNLASLLNLLL